MAKSPSRTSDKVIYIYVTKQEKERFKSACKKEGRKQTTQAHRLLFDWVEKIERGEKTNRGGGSGGKPDPWADMPIHEKKDEPGDLKHAPEKR